MAEYRLTFQERLDCPRSYGNSYSKKLLCEMGGECDGTLYDCCLWDNEELENKVMKHLFEEAENDTFRGFKAD